MREASPIILIGAARSGTKFLRDILASGTETVAVPYDVNYVWRYGLEKVGDDVLDASTLTPRRIKYIRKTLRKLASAAPGDILIEKTVASSLRVPFVEAVFPDARYVHLIRDGRDVTESAMRQWNKTPNWKALSRKVQEIPIRNLDYIAWFGWNFLKGLFVGRKGGKIWGPRFPGIDTAVELEPLSKVCAQQWLECYTRASEDLPRVSNSESRVFTIRYEDLIRDESALSILLEQLQFSEKEIILREFRKKLQPNEFNMWHNLPQQDLDIFEQVLTPALKELGYVE